MMDKDNRNTPTSRRQFLQNLGAGAAAAGSAPLLASTAAADDHVCAAPGCDYDVAVIGGGMAGIAAARDCRENGFRTVIVEARNRLGGRTFTSTFADHVVDLGGSWIHWTQPFVWAEKERYDLDVEETPGLAAPERILIRVGDEAVVVGEAELAALVQAYNAFSADARAILERPYDLRHTWEQALAADAMPATERLAELELTPLQYNFLDGLIASYAHNLTRNMSYLEALRWMSCSGFNSLFNNLDALGRYTLVGGTQSLVDAMLADGQPDVRLATPVKRIEDNGNYVRVTTNRDETLTAGIAIIALPMNVLGDIEFEPALPQSLIDAAGERHTGVGVKVFAKARGRLGSFFTMDAADAPLSTFFTYYEGEDYTLLVGFGADPAKLDIYDEESVQAAMRRLLPAIEIDSCTGYDWVLDPYAKGTYASYRPGWVAKYYDDFQKDRGRLVFGQGDHGEGWRGFIDGAIGAGVRAAQRGKLAYAETASA